MPTDYPAHVAKERTFNGAIAQGAGGAPARRVQEWVTFQSFSCDSLAYQAKEAGLFVKGIDIEKENVDWSDLGTSQIFLVRQTSTDWTHTGFSFEGAGPTYSTVEGNTNDEGVAEGFEVCQRVRSISKKDFIRLQG